MSYLSIGAYQNMSLFELFGYGDIPSGEELDTPSKSILELIRAISELCI